MGFVGSTPCLLKAVLGRHCDRNIIFKGALTADIKGCSEIIKVAEYFSCITLIVEWCNNLIISNGAKGI